MAVSTTKDYYRIRWTGDSDLNGNLLVYTLTHVDPPSDEIRELVLREMSSGKERVLGRGSAPQFSPD